ncbi:MAG TPA: glycosyltransferase family 2 protein [Solirubrobacteraceae bacterium]|jgi:glycosyltransferase involved in cell wall biosynthesis
MNVYATNRPRLVAAEERAATTRQTMLSIVMPAYNERRTIARAIAEVMSAALPCPFELIVVNDGSTDGTTEILQALNHPRARVINHPRNLGKGAALQTGAEVARGTHFVPFDADLEYEPGDLARLLEPVMQGRCEVVYGVRLFGTNTRYQSYKHALGNRALTLAASLMYNASLSDIHTCLKLLPLALFREMNLREDGFGLDTEITAKLLHRGVRPFEIPVSYHSRSVAHGKKITWRDGVKCLQVLARVRSAPKQTGSSQGVEDPLEALAVSTLILSELETTDDAAGRRAAEG